MPPDTTVAFFAREDGRVKAPANLVAVVKKVGNVAVEATPKARDLPQLGDRRRRGASASRSSARRRRLLVTHVGERQQRLLRELEKLAIEHGPGATLGTDEVEAAAHSAERQVWGLVDSFVTGNSAASTRAFLELRDQGESIARLVPLMARRVRDVLAIATRLENGESPAQIKESIRGNPWQTDQRIKQARATDADSLRRALEALADLEIASRGGSELDGRHGRAYSPCDDQSGGSYALPGVPPMMSTRRPVGPAAHRARDARADRGEPIGVERQLGPVVVEDDRARAGEADVELLLAGAGLVVGLRRVVRRQVHDVRAERGQVEAGPHEPCEAVPQRRELVDPGSLGVHGGGQACWPARTRAARAFLRAPVLRCSAPRLTALSIVDVSFANSAVGGRVVALGDGRLEAAEVGADRRRVAAILEALALGAQDALLLGMNVGHVVRRG